ncbi:MAG: replication initiator protein [Arizlama microvirus]|nr:MAG: replication initiator protein [Arizlama microvirus]
MTPINVKSKRTNETHAVPCGRCPKCKARRISGWSFRLIQEDKVSDSSLFITLTYDTKHVPITRNGFMAISKRDVQLFLKRLRKAQSAASIRAKIKYYAVGEYGGKKFRPHYHLILFNTKPELVEQAWQKGQVHYGLVTGASVGYTLKYMSKPKRIPLHINDDRQPEFSLMSKGLGESYVNMQMIQWHHADHLNRMYINLDGGKKAAMPRYYKDKIYNQETRSEIAGYQKGEMEKKFLKNAEKHMDDKNYLKNQKAAIQAAFERMYHKAEQGRDKIS